MSYEHHVFDAQGRKVRLKLLESKFQHHKSETQSLQVDSAGRTSARVTKLATEAARSFLAMPREPDCDRSKKMKKGAPPAVFREWGTGLHRIAYREVVIRFRPGSSERLCRRIWRKHGFRKRMQNPFVGEQYVVYQPNRRLAGAQLVDYANDWTELDEVVFATPNFLSEYERDQLPEIPASQWHLRNVGAGGQKAGEDVDAAGAWAITQGDPGIVVAVLDDGVDIDHPGLQGQIRLEPDPNEPRDRYGRDFVVPVDHPSHFDPRPKIFNYEFNLSKTNDIHGTPCAGLIVASGAAGGAVGLAPRCKILPVKVFHAGKVAPDAGVANAIRYASRFARLLSCSWHGGRSTDVDLALEDAGAAHGGKGAAVFCAAGNWSTSVNFPANHPAAIAVGASTDTGVRAKYSAKGKEVAVVAPSSGGRQDVFSTDVVNPRSYYGYNAGYEAKGGADGRHTSGFTGTSAATPVAAAAGALALSANAELSRDELRAILTETADKIGDDYDDDGHSTRYGYGRVNSAAAVAAAREQAGTG